MKSYKNCWILGVLFILSLTQLPAAEKTREERLEEESKAILERSKRIAQFYSLEEDEEWKEITAAILQSNETKEAIKQLIVRTGRRFFLFKYPSDGLQVKGTLSFVPDSLENPLLIFLRGGNRMFALPHPATDLTCMRNYTVIATTYRGGVSEGTDEFGGNDVRDVENLVEYFPVLQKKLGIQFAPKKRFMLGSSRGGMEMFLSLKRSPFLQAQITKVASLSGLLDMRECINDREDMKRMFIEDFGLVPGKNEEEWIQYREPAFSAPYLRKDLPILILQGTDDLRTGLKEGHRLLKGLEENGNCVTYIEVIGGDHCLTNQPHRAEIIADWFEQAAYAAFVRSWMG